MDHNILWKILQEMGIPDHPTCLLRSLYAGQEATVTTGRGKTDWFQFWKGVHCILSPCILYVVTLLIELLCRIHHANAGLDEAQAGIKISWRNINNLIYSDDIILMAESKEELKSP